MSGKYNKYDMLATINLHCLTTLSYYVVKMDSVFRI